MSGNSSPRSGDRSPRSGDASPRTPSALRNELGAARKAVEVLRQEKNDAEAKMRELKNVLDKERNALRDVLTAARAKVDELTAEGGKKDAEIERLKALLAQQNQSSSTSDAELSQLNARLRELESELAAAKSQGASSSGMEDELKRLRSELAREREASRDQAQRLNDLARNGGDKETLMKQLTSLREQLQSQSKLFSEQMDASRKREEELRQQLVKQRQESNQELSNVRKQLNVALENENAHKVDTLTKQMVRVRRELALRLANMMLVNRMSITGACLYHHWVLVTSQANAEKRLTEEARYKLERARAKVEGRSMFGATPLDRRTHTQTRNDVQDSHRYQIWEQMSPRGGRGDGREHSSPRSTPNSSPARQRPTGAMLVQPMGRTLNRDGL